MKLLEGKTALITGASRGIGKAIALAYAKHGANVAFSDLNRDANMESLEKELSTMGVKGKGYASEAVQCLMVYAFTSLALRRVFAITQIQNRAANRLLKRIGFDWKGHFTEDSSDKGDAADEYIYELLR